MVVVHGGVLRDPARASENGIGRTLECIDERLPEVLIGERVQHGVDGAVGVAEYGEALEHVQAPAAGRRMKRYIYICVIYDVYIYYSYNIHMMRCYMQR